MGTTPYIFSYNAWVVMFPELQGVNEIAANGYFNIATLYIRNDGRGPISDPNMQSTLLNLTVAHIATLFSAQRNGVPVTGGGTESSPLVGRITNGTEGSVSVQADMPDQPPGAAWWLQTKYGAAVWQAMRPFRTFRYLGNPRRRIFNPPMRYFGFGTGI